MSKSISCVRYNDGSVPYVVLRSGPVDIFVPVREAFDLANAIREAAEKRSHVGLAMPCPCLDHRQ